MVEVTSDSTEPIDRREKLLAYRGIANLTLYLIGAQDRREVTVHTRESGGSWQTHRVYDEEAIDVGCLGARLSLHAVYEDVLP